MSKRADFRSGVWRHLLQCWTLPSLIKLIHCVGNKVKAGKCWFLCKPPCWTNPSFKTLNSKPDGYCFFSCSTGWFSGPVSVHCWLMSSFLSISNPKPSFPELFSECSSPSLYWYWWLDQMQGPVSRSTQSPLSVQTEWQMDWEILEGTAPPVSLYTVEIVSWASRLSST